MVDRNYVYPRVLEFLLVLLEMKCHMEIARKMINRSKFSFHEKYMIKLAEVVCKCYKKIMN